MDWTNVVVVLISIGGSGFVGWLVNRRKDGASVGLIDAQTWTERDKIRAGMQNQLDTMFDELTEARVRIRQLEDNEVTRERVILKMGHEIETLKQNEVTLTERLKTLENYLRNTIRQLKTAKIAPDVPQEVIEQLFKGL